MSSSSPVDYRKTVNLLQTGFSQKANLREKEPRILEKWKALGLYEKRLAKNKGNAPYILHDGPPYANGDIHLGHSLNKCLKDFIVRFQLMNGRHAPYVPGWDCHGLPIEQKVMEKKGKSAGGRAPVEIRGLCREYALKYVDIQREQFRRLGVQGDWYHPYLTLTPDYEVGILTAFRRMVERGLVFKGLRPVHWDPVFRTALAEAEIEYNDSHQSPSIYVRFPLRDAERIEGLRGLPAPALVIWTTTPWTLPANLAVSLHPEFDYVAWRREGETLIVARGLLEAFRREAGLADEGEVVATFKGNDLVGLRCAHPLLEKDSVVILGEHVTLEQGTGCVHTAPGHGADDFEIGRRYGLPAFNPVDDAGCFTTDYPDMAGVNVFAANPKIVEQLREKGLLVHEGRITHSYPYSWRSHKPVIVRATEQWFMSVDRENLRSEALRIIHEDVKWIPAWGRDRINNMVEGRPDWCLSRQRSWGVPIPSLYDKRERTSLLPLGVLDRFMEHVAREGTDCWYTRPVEDFLPPELAGDPERYDKEYNILDVWFDSGASHVAVLEQRPELSSPADLYLEGSDQHRGWFQSSLLVSLAARDRAPYRAVLTHGFILDAKGEAMSKSKGNVISPLEVIDKLGADVLRLWVASEDYRSDVTVSQTILDHIATAYRRIRNTVRFLLMNISDFDPKRDRVAWAELGEIDRWALGRLGEVIETCRRGFEQFEFHRVFQAINTFCTVDLSSLYLDASKDILYCAAPGDGVRRSTQTALWEIASALLRLMAPILSFTADEAWEFLPGAEEESVHLAEFPRAGAEWKDSARAESFRKFALLRGETLKQVEALRRDSAQEVGASLDVQAILTTSEDSTVEWLSAHRELLRRWLIVSHVEVRRGPSPEGFQAVVAEDVPVTVEVTRCGGRRCARCWMWSHQVGDDPHHEELCPRCSDVVRRSHP